MMGTKVMVCAMCLGVVSALEGCAQDERATSDTAALLDRVATLEAQMARDRDRRDIHEVYVRYARGVDLLDEEAYRSAFWPEAQLNYGTQLNSVDDHWNVHMQKAIKRKMVAWGHLLTNETVDVDGDVAHVEVYVTPLFVNREKPEEGILISGRYIDRLDRRNGQWRIAQREFIPHFTMRVDASNFRMWDRLYKDVRSDCMFGGVGKRATAYVRPLIRRDDPNAGPPCNE